jgi:hypothetical protein
MAILTLSDRDTAGATYGTAVTNFINALVDLAAKEQILSDRSGGNPLDGGHFGAQIALIDMIPLWHGKYAPNVKAAPITQLVEAAKRSLIASGS